MKDDNIFTSVSEKMMPQINWTIAIKQHKQHWLSNKSIHFIYPWPISGFWFLMFSEGWRDLCHEMGLTHSLSYKGVSDNVIVSSWFTSNGSQRKRFSVIWTFIAKTHTKNKLYDKKNFCLDKLRNFHILLM